MNNWKMPEVFDALRSWVSETGQVYLVGGAVRDLLLQKASHDLDFGVTGRAIPLARKFANQVGAAFYVMDDENDVARVLGTTAAGEDYTLDFTGLRGASIQEDMQARDFTINAMAVDITTPGTLIDPLNGALDLKEHQLRACSPGSMQADPLRVMRGVRQSLAFNLSIHPHTYQWMKSAVPGLHHISPERQRDELFRILSGSQVASALRILNHLGVLEILLPELIPLQTAQQGPPHVYNVWEHTLALVSHLEALYSVLVGTYQKEATNLTHGLAVLKLGRYRQQLADHFNTCLNPQRSLRSLLFLAGLYHDAAKPLTRSVDTDGKVHYYEHDQMGIGLVEQRARSLMLSNAEIERLKTIVGGHMRPHFLARETLPSSRRAIYRYFRASGPAGVDTCLLALADMLAVYGPTLPQQVWQNELEACRALLEAWFEKPAQLVTPPRLLSGDELKTIFGLKPGPQIGELLEAVAEAQAAGEISSRAQAEEFIRTRLS